MFLSHKSNVIQAVGHTEHECRKQTKGMTNEEYNAWVDSITTAVSYTHLTLPTNREV